MEHLLITKDDEYVRDINPLKNYVDLTTFYITKSTGEDVTKVRTWVRELVSNTPIPRIAFLSREEQFDRVQKVEGLDEYIFKVIKSDRIIAPTGTVYKKASEELSMFTPLIVGGREERAVHKGLMHKYKLEGDTEKADAENENQNNVKIDNNSASGAALSPTTIIHTQTTHPSLTSTGRLSTSIANAVNEKLLASNVHLNSPEATIDYCNVMAYTAKRMGISECIRKYGIHVPTPEETLRTVLNSSNYYWRDRRYTAKIRDYIEKCTDEERCNIVYNGSVWALIEYNPDFMRKFIDDFTEPATTSLGFEESSEILKNTYGDLKVLGIYLCHENTKGKSLKACEKEDHETYGLIANTIKKINEKFEEYGLLIETFLKLEVLPGNIYDIESLYRKCVVTSDTDSTNFTTQAISHFVTGEFAHKAKDMNINFFMTYLSSMMVCQALGIMSANIGVDLDRIREISMKNEFYTPIHMLTPSAKNYIMLLGGQEGSILPETDLVTKGVELRSSKIPQPLMKIFDEYKVDIFNRVYRGEPLYLKDILTLPVSLENLVKASLLAGEFYFLPTEYIKQPDAYTLEEEARQWQYHMFYEEVFGDKYGRSSDIPYTAYLMPVELDGKRKVAKWLDNIKDPTVKEKATNFIHGTGKGLTSIIMPTLIFSSSKVPEEIQCVASIDKITYTVMSNWYLYLESIGIYLKNKHRARMLHEEFTDYADVNVIQELRTKMGINK